MSASDRQVDEAGLEVQRLYGLLQAAIQRRDALRHQAEMEALAAHDRKVRQEVDR